MERRPSVKELLEQETVELHCWRCDKPIVMSNDGFKRLIESLRRLGWRDDVLDGLIDFPISCIEDCELANTSP